ncbi:MAG: hypothetical protein M4579_006618 [Chaenotheca gracillima]|nr:MAG: hypothetical protein M4579_006618 [Chaenotheca gracillima]
MASQTHVDDQGASPRELLMEACRRNNTELLQELLKDTTRNSSSTGSSAEDDIAQLLNDSADGIGNNCLHIAAAYGNYEVLDMLLDQEGLEVDPLDRLEGDTPLHKSVRWVNELSRKDWEGARSLVDLLLDAGADPRIRNKAKLKAMDLVDPANKDLRSALQKAEFTMNAGNDVVDEDEDDGPTGSASDSE